ncbi:MAG: dihydrolipoyl dehydrogenase, partial [Candidatus Omnitrophica bacterium]|nr:dihydrolipoyl dehydrogenase [Candidatus Omnitrophota bacterium]
EEGQKFFEFENAIIATGSVPMVPKAWDLGNPRVMTSTGALELVDIPENLLVIGGGYIGMELGTVYAGLGSRVTVAEALDTILAGADADLVRPVARAASRLFAEVRLGARVAAMVTDGKKIRVTMDHAGKTLTESYDRVLVAVGRRPNTEDLGLENAGVELDEKGFVRSAADRRTSNPRIFTVGDAAGGVLLAHKAAREARHAVDAIRGEAVSADGDMIPAVIFTDPEVAWCGLTESEARAKSIPIEVARFGWPASGKAVTFDRTDGVTKLILEPKTARVLGVGITGAGAGELIGEGILAVQMCATAEDIALSVHPHPTLTETYMEAAEAFYGVATHTIGRTRPPAR